MKKVSKELEFIRGFSKESVNDICNKYGINRSNLISNKCTQDKIDLVYSELVYRISSMINKITEEEFLDRSHEYYELKYGEDSDG